MKARGEKRSGSAVDKVIKILTELRPFMNEEQRARFNKLRNEYRQLTVEFTKLLSEMPSADEISKTVEKIKQEKSEQEAKNDISSEEMH